MKKSLTLLLAVMAFGHAFAQETETTLPEPTGTVEKSIFSLQTGAIGIWGSNELRLSNRWALRTEVGLDMWFYDTFQRDGRGTIIAPSISLEPRWYYNIAKRARKGKHTANNSASFVTLAIEYWPDLFTLGNAPSYVYVPSQITVIPKWGIRRAIAKSNFNYELGIGIGYQRMLDKTIWLNMRDDVTADIHVRIGYTF